MAMCIASASSAVEHGTQAAVVPHGKPGTNAHFNQESGFIGRVSSPALHWTEKANHSSCMSLNVEIGSKCWQQNTETQKYFGKVADHLCS